jgi:O-antigen/teichoic acid export membrane protein
MAADPLLARLRHLAAGPFVRGVAYVAGGTAVSQIILILVAPITSRQYGPAAYGVVNVFVSTAAILSPLAGLAYAYALPLPDDDRDALALLGLTVRIAVAAFAVLAVVFLVFGGSIAGWVQLPHVTWMVLLVPPLVLVAGLSNVYGQWLIRKREFRTLGVRTAVQSIVQNGTRVAVGTVVPTAAALVLVQAAGSVFGLVLVYLGARPSLRVSSAAELDAEPGRQARRRALAHRYRDFPLYREPQMLLNIISAYIPMILLAALFDPVVTGLYGLARNVLGMPMGLVADSIGKVLLPHAAEAAREGHDVHRLLVRSTRSLAIIGLPPFALIVLFGPALFAFVFGADWRTTGEYARWLAPSFYLVYLNTPSIQVIPLIGLQGLFLVWEVVQTTARIAAILVGAAVFSSSITAVALYSLVGVAANIVLIGVTVVMSRRRRRMRF